MSDYTSEPWTFDGEWIQGPEYAICLMADGHGLLKEKDPDLITAAPKMFKACKAMVAMISQSGFSPKMMEVDPDLLFKANVLALDALRAAGAK